MEVENEYERTLNMYNCYTISIRQHGSAVYVGMVVVVCMYTMIQWTTVASVLQSENWTNRTVEAKVRTIQKTMIPVLSRINAPACRKRP